MVRIEHVALWVKDLEKMKDFYLRYFDVNAGEKYTNPKKSYSSYFINFSDGCRLELMHLPDILDLPSSGEEYGGWAHIAISLGSKEKVLDLTEKLREDGFTVKGEPRYTGDGYFESVILDPENNPVELTI
jgi:lactoylglutathione lyase